MSEKKLPPIRKSIWDVLLPWDDTQEKQIKLIIEALPFLEFDQERLKDAMTFGGAIEVTGAEWASIYGKRKKWWEVWK